MMVQSYEQNESLLNTYSESKTIYSLKLLDTCKRDYLKLVKKNTSLRHLIESILEDLKIRPEIGQTLYANFPGCRSIHFGGNSYRIIYRVFDKPEAEILILDIGHRRTSYNELARTLGQGK